jgi:two-component system KDP operon response regulator KdpE
MSDAAFKPLVLVIDDEPQLRRLLRVTIEAGGFRIIEAATGQDGIVFAAQQQPDVVLLDLSLPDLDGITVLKRLREWSQVPVVILSVRDRDEEKIGALDAGADDYVTKPFSSGELLARLRAALRRTQPAEAGALVRAGDVEIDLSARSVRKQGEPVKLTPTEYALLRLLARHPGRVLTQRQLLQEVWGPNSIGHTHYLRVYVAHLREKLEDNPAQPKLIITEPAVGYRFMT